MLWQDLFRWKLAAPLGFQCPISLYRTMEKVQPCPRQDQNKSQHAVFLLHIKLNPLCPCSLLQAPVAARPTWFHALRWKSMQMQEVSALPAARGRKDGVGAEKRRGGGQEERERSQACFFVLLRLLFWVWNKPGAFQKNQSTSQAFAAF